MLLVNDLILVVNFCTLLFKSFRVDPMDLVDKLTLLRVKNCERSLGVDRLFIAACERHFYRSNWTCAVIGRTNTNTCFVFFGCVLPFLSRRSSVRCSPKPLATTFGPTCSEFILFDKGSPIVIASTFPFLEITRCFFLPNVAAFVASLGNWRPGCDCTYNYSP